VTGWVKTVDAPKTGRFFYTLLRVRVCSQIAPLNKRKGNPMLKADSGNAIV